jgi:hypothetical protein
MKWTGSRSVCPRTVNYNETFAPTAKWKSVCIRPDLLASVSINTLGSGTAYPHDEHVKGVLTFAEYIATSHDVGSTLGGEPEVDLFGFSDAAYLTTGDSLSRLAYCFFLNLTSSLKIRQTFDRRRKLSSKLLTKRSDRLSGFGTSSRS